MNVKLYESELSSAEWQTIQPLFPRAKKKQNPRKYSYKVIFNAILYTLKTGCAWRLLPNDYPPWQSVYYYFSKWKKLDLLEKLNTKLREKLRESLGRDKDPSVAIIDSQTIKASDTSENTGYDGGKKINGRKRHIVVDVLGLLIAVFVSPANFSDRNGAKRNFEKIASSPRLKKIWADGSYTGTIISDTHEDYGWSIEVIKPVTGKGPGFHVRPWCWIVERSFAWLTKNRRLCREYERDSASSEALIQGSVNFRY